MKKRSAVNPLREYRRIQREIRAIFDPFTAKNCPTCATPCCIKPTRLTPLDVSLAEGIGHKFAHLMSLDPYVVAVEHAEQRLGSSAVTLLMADEQAETPCEFLSDYRCTFPDDLRPFGCTTYICNPMHERMAEPELRKLKRLVRQISDTHVILLRAIRQSGRDRDPVDV